MDYCGDIIGIRVSEDQLLCWVIFKYGSQWDTVGDSSPVRDLAPFELQAGGPYSALRLAWTVLSHQNPHAKSELQELIRTVTQKPPEWSDLAGH